jgi:hypothetical protein
MPRWWQSDGALIPLRYGRPLRRIAQRIAEDEPHLKIKKHQGRGASAALAARLAGLPAITIGCLDHRGIASHSHQGTDTAPEIDRQALDRALQFALLLIDGIDAAVGEARAESSATPA